MRLLRRSRTVLLALAIGGTALACSADDGAAGSTGSAGGGGATSASASTTSVSAATDGATGGGASTSTTTSSAGGAAEGGGAAQGGGGGAPPAEEPCPAFEPPSTCFGREVMAREWGPTAVGDGSYFADQAPNRLGFTRVQGRMWVVKFQTEANTYFGRVSANGDATAGVAWIARGPCDATFGVDNRLVAWGAHGGGSLDFVVVRDDADEAILDGDPAFAGFASMPRLRGGYCYTVAFENVATLPDSPLDAAAIEGAEDDCGASGDGTCYYLAFDFNHLLHDVTSGQLIAGNVIAGLTH